MIDWRISNYYNIIISMFLICWRKFYWARQSASSSTV